MKTKDQQVVKEQIYKDNYAGPQPPKLEFNRYSYAEEAYRKLRDSLKMMVEMNTKYGYFSYSQGIERLDDYILERLRHEFESKGFYVKFNFRKTKITISWGAK